MSDENRMTATDEPMCSVCGGSGVPLSGGTCICGGTGRELEEIIELRREHQRLRADLAELVAALPRCSFPGCTAHATRTDINCENVCDDIKHGAYMSLDPAHPEGPNAEYDLPWAPFLRRLAERSKR